MEIKLTFAHFLFEKRLFKVIMRTFVYLFFTTIFAFSPDVIVSQNSKILVEEDGVLTVDEVFRLIKTQTDYKFFYEEGIFDSYPKIKIKKGTIRTNKLLMQCLSNGNLEVELTQNNTIIIKEKPLSANEVLQQDFEISGTVTDKNGQPLPGANVLEKGTTNGTQTDFDGKFSLDVAGPNAIIVISYLGFLTKEITLTGETSLLISLQEDAAILNEIVVVGYGKSEKRKITSAISTIETDNIGQAPFASITDGLAGRAPGLFVRSNGGSPGSIPTISIRGGGTPSFFVDGVVVSAEEFSRIPPNDIEEISLLKDNASAAVFGFDASNGVVVVTTKRGKKDRITFNYNVDFTYNHPTEIPEYVDPVTRFLAFNEAHNRLGNTDPFIPQQTIDNYISNNDPIKYPSLNPFKEVISSLSAQRRHNFGLNGTTGNTQLYMSLDYFDQESIYNKGDDFGLDRYSFRSNVTHEIESIGLTVSNNITLSRQINVEPPAGIGEIWSHVRNWFSGAPMVNYEGNYVGSQNPLAESDPRAGYNKNENNRVNGQLSLEWKVPNVEGLSLKTVGNFRYVHSFIKNFRANPRGTSPIYNFETNEPISLGGAELYQRTDRYYEALFQGHVNYLRQFDKHNIELTGIYEQRKNRNDFFDASRRNFVSSAVDELFAGPNQGQNLNGNANEEGRVGYIGRVKYDYDGKYVIEASGRYDGFGGFEKGRQYKLFPSLSLGWNIDKEPFMSSLLEKLNISYLKLRGSWGQVGRISGAYSFLPTYSLINNAYYIDNEYNIGFREDNLVPPSETATWETIEDRNIGVDFGLFNNKLTGSFDGFFRRETGFVAQPQDTYTTPLGIGLPEVNTDAAFRRAGIEGQLNYTMNINETSKFTIGVNASYFDQLWEKRSDEDDVALSNPYSRLTQATDYVTTGYENLGYYQTPEQLLNNARTLGGTSLQQGDIRYNDFNGDGKIDNNDQIRIGKGAFPHVVYNISLGYQGNGFRIDALLNGTSNTQVYLGDIYRTSQAETNNYALQFDTWSENNIAARFPRMMTTNTNGGNNEVSSDFWLKNASFLRLKSISLTYDLKRITGDSLKFFDKLDLLLSGVNLMTVSPIKKYYLDPETSSSNNYGYPVTQSYNIGLRASF
ncbi:SusC/RagA family TonB-linked outer membrane protein [Aestuariivivens sediminis]|uniref:SusC/RagA family TonB-linked outer membrane protein n=1 Tax=Aestuariivivens sediminis TaxID=2913557 RepID=UPI001F57C215|nr:SusC/RagA family TonB-linked outer membrane protein [Aestuariivivens sediminis]